MLLTITYTGEDTQNIGYLLYKRPGRIQKVDLTWGRAYIFYTRVNDEATEVNLLLDIDPLDIVRGKNSQQPGLFDYVNDRIYTSSGFMANAIKKAFGTASSGKENPESPISPNTELDLQINITGLRIKGSKEYIKKVFEPLGYMCKYKVTEMYTGFSYEESPYVDLYLVCKKTIKDVLNQLIILLPVFDRGNYKYLTENEISMVVTRGSGWLEDHPMRYFILDRYFFTIPSYRNRCIEEFNKILDESKKINETENTEVEEEEDDVKKPPVEKKQKLSDARNEATLKACLEAPGSSIIDLGCSDGRFMQILEKQDKFTKIAGMDVSSLALKKAESRLRLKKNDENPRIKVFQGSLVYKDDRINGYDIAVLNEVIEHIDFPRLKAVTDNVFKYANYETVIVTTPNTEYNVNYEWLDTDDLRIGDHRFEFTRDEFSNWCYDICKRYGYDVQIIPVGEDAAVRKVNIDKDGNEHPLADLTVGSPTQMGVFTRCKK